LRNAAVANADVLLRAPRVGHSRAPIHDLDHNVEILSKRFQHRGDRFHFCALSGHIGW